MDYTAARFWFDVLHTLATIALGAWIYLANRSAARKADVDEKISWLRDRVTITEQQLKAVPRHDDMEKIHSRISATNETLNILLGEFQAARRQLEGINNFLLSQAKQ